MWLITEHRKSLSTEKDSGSPAVNNLIIIFLQLHLKHYFKWLCSHFYHPHSSSCVAEGGRPTAGDFCTYCQPAPGTAPAQKTIWVDVVCWKKYTQMPWHQVKSSPILTDPQGMTPGYCYQYSKESSDWKNLQFIYQGSCWGAALVLQTSILLSRSVRNLDLPPDPGIQQWPDIEGCVDQPLSHLNCWGYPE